MTTGRHPARLDPIPLELIDRSKTIEFEFNGRPSTSPTRATLSARRCTPPGFASSPAASSITAFAGCCASPGNCPNCLMTVDGVPNVRACVRRVEQGMKVKGQNAWPGLETRPVFRHRPISLGAAHRVLLQGPLPAQGALGLLGFGHSTACGTWQRQSRCRGSCSRAPHLCPRGCCRRRRRHRGDVGRPGGGPQRRSRHPRRRSACARRQAPV